MGAKNSKLASSKVNPVSESPPLLKNNDYNESDDGDFSESEDNDLDSEIYKVQSEITISPENEPQAKKLLNAIKDKDNIEVNFGVIGKSKVGKSTFINTFRGLKPKHPKAAKVNHKECTDKIEPYPFPNAKQRILWDLPGVGTVKFPRDTYLCDIEIQIYDCFIFLVSESVIDLDKWLYTELLKLNKKCFIVRTKMDDVYARHIEDDEIEDTPENREKNKAILMVDIKENLSREFQCKINNVYCIACSTKKGFDSFELDRLTVDIIDCLPEDKGDVVALDAPGYSDPILMRKYSAIKKRIPLFAGAAALGNAIPVPFLGIAFDMGILMVMDAYIRKKFNVDDKQLNSFKKAIKGNVAAHIVGGLAQAASLMAIIGRYSIAFVPAILADTLNWIPIVGAIIGATTSFSFTIFMGLKIAEERYQLALRVSEIVAAQKNNTLKSSNLQNSA